MLKEKTLNQKNYFRIKKKCDVQVTVYRDKFLQ